MYQEVTLQSLFANEESATSLLETLTNYKEEGVRHIYSIGYKTIEITMLINRIRTFQKNGKDLEEIYRQLICEIGQ